MVRTRSAVGRGRHYLKANGWRWTILHAVGRTADRVASIAEARSRELERHRDLPGTNSIDRNRAIWTDHDWSGGGEEWSESAQWRDSVVHTFLVPNVAVDSTVLEIGPGAGRWTVPLHARAKALYLLDITDVTLKICAERLADPPRPVCLLGDGNTLAGVPSAAIDVVWSFDVFVHIAPVDQRSYLAEIGRVLRPGGAAVLHHGGTGGASGGWRSAMTAELFGSFVSQAGLSIVDQRAEWDRDGTVYRPSTVGDLVTVLRK